MKHFPVFLLAVVLPFQVLLSQDEPDTDRTTSYAEKVVSSEYSIRFKNTDEKTSFKLLREFLKEKEGLLEAYKGRIKKDKRR